MILWVRNTKGLGLGFLFEGRVGEKNGWNDHLSILGVLGLLGDPRRLDGY